MSEARGALASAIFQRLTADAALVALVGADGIHDRAPRTAPHPFVAFGEFRTQPLDSDLAPASEHRIEVEAYSRYDGKAEISAVASRVEALLHDAVLALDGHRLAQLRHVATRIRPARGDRSFRTVIRFRAITEPLT